MELFFYYASALAIIGNLESLAGGGELQAIVESRSPSKPWLIPCKDSDVFLNRWVGGITELTSTLLDYDEGTPGYLVVQDRISRTDARFKKYAEQGLLCGSDGLPHLVVTNQFDKQQGHAGEFFVPAVIFIYIAGYIGWSARAYLLYAKTTDDPFLSEVFINVPAALGIMFASFIWPLSFLNELASGDLFVPDDEVTISPR
jgi:photosystem I subunit 3